MRDGTVTGRDVVQVLPEMSREQRRAAIEGLRRRDAVVELPASWELRHGDAVHRDHRDPHRGVASLQGRAYQVHADRAVPEYRGNVFAPRRSLLDVPLSFSGEVDPADRVVRGHVRFETRAYGRTQIVLTVALVPLLTFLGVLGDYGLLPSLAVAVLVAAALGSLVVITPRRRARAMLRDLQRLAAMAAGVEVPSRYPTTPRPRRMP